MNIFNAYSSCRRNKASFTSLNNRQANLIGLTLVELLIVIAMISGLLLASVFVVSRVGQKARDSQRISDIKQIREALDLYLNDKNQYPLHPSPGIVLGGDDYDYLCDTTVGFQADSTNCVFTYLSIVPAEKIHGIADYIYTSIDEFNYKITFELEGEIAGLGPGVVTVSQFKVE